MKRKNAAFPGNDPENAALLWHLPLNSLLNCQHYGAHGHIQRAADAVERFRRRLLLAAPNGAQAGLPNVGKSA